MLKQNKLVEITNLLNQGISSRQIAQIVKVSKSSVNNLSRDLRPLTPRPKPGPPKKLTPREARDAVRLMQTSRAKTAVEVTREINKHRETGVCAQTVRRALIEAGLKAEKKQKKPKLTTRHKKVRLEWAKAHAGWTVEDFKRVIWSDETKVNRVCSDGVQYVWKRPTKTLTQNQVIETVKFGGGHIMAWGCLTWAGLGGLVQVVGSMNAAQYCSILTRGLVPTLDAATLLSDFPARDELIFQHDNDPKHTSALAKSWLEAQGLRVMSWPAQSPDLNPIEHVWAELKRRLGQYPEAPRGAFELWSRVEIEWKRIPLDYCRRLVESMPSRVKAVISARGAHTKY